MNSKPDKVIPALYGGIIMALVSSIPFVSFINCFCCAGILFGGVMAVFFYKNNFTPDTPPFTAGDCIIVGLMAGIVGAVAGTFLSVVFVMMFGNVMVEFLTKWLHDMNVNIPEQAWKALEDAAHNSAGLGTFVLQLFPNLFIYGIFGLLGGLIGYSIFKPRNLMMPPHPMPPPPPISQQQ